MVLSQNHNISQPIENLNALDRIHELTLNQSKFPFKIDFLLNFENCIFQSAKGAGSLKPETLENNYKLYYFRRYYLAKSIVCQRANCFVRKIEFLCKFIKSFVRKLNWFSSQLHSRCFCVNALAREKN